MIFLANTLLLLVTVPVESLFEAGHAGGVDEFRADEARCFLVRVEALDVLAVVVRHEFPVR